MQDEVRTNIQIREEMFALYEVFYNLHLVPAEMAEYIEPIAFFEFSSGNYRVGSDKHQVYIDIRRSGGVRHAVRVGWRTRPDTAVSTDNFIYKEGILDFLPGQRVKRIHIDLANRHISNDIDFTVELTSMEGLLWELPDGSVDTGRNYEANINMISKMNFVKLTNERIAKPSGLSVTHDINTNNHVGKWNEISGSNNIAEYEVQWRQANADNLQRLRISGLDSKVYIPGDQFEPVENYNLRLLAIDFAYNQEQTEFVNFVSAKAPPNPPKYFGYDRKNKKFYWSEVDEKADTEFFEIAYCLAENAVECEYIEEISADAISAEVEGGADLNDNNYIAVIRGFNSSGYGPSTILQIKKQD